MEEEDKSLKFYPKPIRNKLVSFKKIDKENEKNQSESSSDSEKTKSSTYNIVKVKKIILNKYLTSQLNSNKKSIFDEIRKRFNFDEDINHNSSRLLTQFFSLDCTDIKIRKKSDYIDEVEYKNVINTQANKDFIIPSILDVLSRRKGSKS